MQKRLTSWAIQFLRYGLCAVALLYLYFKVPWNDFATLSDGTRAKITAIRDGEVDVVVNGATQTVRVDSLQRLPESKEPNIEYGIRSVVRGIDVRLALVSLLIFLPVPLFSALRLVWMLQIQEVKLSWWHSVMLTFAGNFFNFALPGTTGGDLFKAYYITRFTHHKTEAVTTVFLDRVIGLLGLMIMASGMFVYAWNRLDWAAHYRNSLALGLAVIWSGLLVGCIFVFSSRLRRGIGLPRLAEMLPAGEQLLRVGRATVKMRQHIFLVCSCLAVTIALQTLVILSGFQMARALGMAGEFELYFICIAIGFLIAAVPISPPQAFGVLEYAYIQFFTHDGLNTVSAAVAFALAIRLIQLFWALPGVLVPILGLHLPSRNELSSLEEPEPASAEPSPAARP